MLRSGGWRFTTKKLISSGVPHCSSTDHRLPKAFQDIGNIGVIGVPKNPDAGGAPQNFAFNARTRHRESA
jgi:hypothetical protein